MKTRHESIQVNIYTDLEVLNDDGSVIIEPIMYELVYGKYFCWGKTLKDALNHMIEVLEFWEKQEKKNPS